MTTMTATPALHAQSTDLVNLNDLDMDEVLPTKQVLDEDEIVRRAMLILEERTSRRIR